LAPQRHIWNRFARGKSSREKSAGFRGVTEIRNFFKEMHFHVNTV